MDVHLQEVALDHLKTALHHLKKHDHFKTRLLEKVDELQKKNFELVSGIEQLSVLKPSLSHSPLSSFPVVLPSFLIDNNSKLVTIYGDNHTKAGIKPKAGNTFSIFGSSDKEPQVAIITADRSVPSILSKLDTPYYFEITILKLGSIEESGSTCIGFVGEGDSMKGALGSSSNSYGLNILQQKAYNNNKGQPYPGMYHNGGKYGCGWDQKNGLIFFTVDGLCGGTVFRDVKGKLKPAISLSGPGTEVVVNFGTTPFVYDVNIDWKYFREIEIKVEECEEKGLCSYVATSTLYFPQFMFGCKTCELVGHYGMCEVCAQVCHAGHDLVPAKLTPQFFCDCGNLTDEKKKNLCKCLKEH